MKPSTQIGFVTCVKVHSTNRSSVLSRPWFWSQNNIHHYLIYFTFLDAKLVYVKYSNVIVGSLLVILLWFQISHTKCFLASHLFYLLVLCTIIIVPQ